MERAILVNLSTSRREKEEAPESMAELAGLAKATGAEVVRQVFHNRPRPSPRFFVGAGKVEEIARLRAELGAETVIFDHNLTPTQQRSLERSLRVKVVDRTQLILDIFAQRARSNEGKLQVELARLSYLLPRLAGRGVDFSQQGAGIRTRGPGEKKLEEDRRRIADRITKVRRDIARLEKRRAGQRASRRQSPVPTVSLVGYTSAGKSTLFNALAREKRYTSAGLFATLDPVLRRVTFPDGAYFFLSDTVGFIRKLPVELVTSFKTTLEEVREADALCHVIDVTSPQSGGHAEAVDAVLAEIGATEVPVLRVYNKIDLLPPAEKELLIQANAQGAGESIYVSAATGEGLSDLRVRLRDLLFRSRRLYRLRLPREAEEDLRAIGRRSLVLRRRENDGHVELAVIAEPSAIMDYVSYLERGEEPW